MWSISKKTGVSVEEIKAANNLSSNLLSVGQKLIIPEQNIAEQPGNFEIYIVKSGDTLYSVARTYGVSVDDLLSYNNLSSTNLSIGQQLLIPVEKESNYTTYRVKAGDSLYSIAREYKISVDELKKANNLSINLLSVGQTLIIPTASQTTPDTNGTTTYTVQSGDSLYSIARRYDTTIDQIKKMNNLNSNTLSIGQKLVIPSANAENVYVVKSGDNLYSIARNYNTTVDEIKRRNNLNSNLLSIGQVLII